MSEAKKLHDRIVKPAENRYARELNALIRGCPHKELTDWMDEWWAIAHSTGYMVQQCKRCDKEIHRRTSCHTCGKEILDSDIKKGDGSAWNLVGGGCYCPDCFEKAKKNPDCRGFNNPTHKENKKI
jgi:hypothetical protein